MPRIRPMLPSDIPVGLALCRLAGWNQLEGDWRRLLTLAPDGVFVAEEEGERCGTASAIHYAHRTAWIGMVLVHPAFRRRGIGSALMRHGIEQLQARGVEAIKLDATDDGRPVYLKLGFQDERPAWRCQATERPPVASAAPVRPIVEEDWPALVAMDQDAFDADRMALLRLLYRDGASAILYRQGEVAAYGFSRPGFHASHLGPVVARDGEAARQVVETLLAGLPEGPVYWDLLPDNAAAVELCRSLGFAVVRRLTRMYLGTQMHPGEVSRVYAATGFELG